MENWGAPRVNEHDGAAYALYCRRIPAAESLEKWRDILPARSSLYDRQNAPWFKLHGLHSRGWFRD
jgi:hypothetical protein